ncbi:MAG: hypothetical protein Q9182_004710 [Xanthomendoza sp. 2 TL-2023]
MTDDHNDIHESVTSTNGQLDYSQWSSAKLLERVTLLEKELRDQTARSAALPSSGEVMSNGFNRYESLAQKRRTFSPISKPKRSRSNRQFDPSKYSTRLIALKFAYLGQRYNGLEYHANNNTRYPTIEEELWKALDKAKLIFPTPNTTLEEGEPNWEGCEYSKSGRTDKGVSAFGQVIGIRVRSNRPLETNDVERASANGKEDIENDESDHEFGDGTMPSKRTAFDSIRDEIPYPQILNRLLPREIRVLAWCPSPPADFSARFCCGERCYKYSFTQPAFTPTVGPADFLPNTSLPSRLREGWLDIEAMEKAARKFEGSHDFRNFCKVDPCKQIENFRRVINSASIVEVKPGDGGSMGYLSLPRFHQYPSRQSQPATNAIHANNGDEPRAPETSSTPKMYAFKVRGSGFLWHQVRHMVAILFLVGQGLEKPCLVDDLLNIEKIPRKPTYDMAVAAPLVLEECNFPGAGLHWVHCGDYTGNEAGIKKAAGKGGGKYGLGGAVDELWRVWHKHKIDETLVGSLLDLVVRSPDDSLVGGRLDRSEGNLQSQKVYDGGNTYRPIGKYVPVLERPRMEAVDVVNAKYLKRKGLDPPERTGVEVSVPE